MGDEYLKNKIRYLEVCIKELERRISELETKENFKERNRLYISMK